MRAAGLRNRVHVQQSFQSSMTFVYFVGQFVVLDAFVRLLHYVQTALRKSTQIMLSVGENDENPDERH